MYSAALLQMVFSLSKIEAETTGNHSKLVYPGSDGKLVYQPYTDEGDIIPDFSNCGYMGGGVAIPLVPVKIVLSPDPDSKDDLSRIQDAIDRVSAMPLDESGFRGAILLKKGRYQLGDTLKIRASGVILRGESQEEDGTVLIATKSEEHTLISVSGQGKPGELNNTRRSITDEYVPVGARSFHVDDTSCFEIDDQVIVYRPSTAEWLRDIGMDRIAMKHPRVKQWKPGSKDLPFIRKITAIQDNLITVDSPLLNALQKEYGGGYIYKYEYPGRIQQVGIENLRGESEFAGKDDEDHGWNFIVFDRIQNGWVRDVTSRYFGYGCVGLRKQSKHITVQDCQCLDPVSKITGGRRYSFWISGQLNLVQRCYARHGRHDFVMHSVVSGPNVFLDCRADNAHSDSGPHHRWATGTLYDNVVVNGHDLDVQDRQWSGTGHGWAGSQMVFWNCIARRIRCQKPPTSQNFAIGCIGDKATGNYVKDHPDGWWESHGKPVQPRSLYLKQLEDRSGKIAVNNIAKQEMDYSALARKECNQ